MTTLSFVTLFHMKLNSPIPPLPTAPRPPSFPITLSLSLSPVLPPSHAAKFVFAPSPSPFSFSYAQSFEKLFLSVPINQLVKAQWMDLELVGSNPEYGKCF